MGYRIRHNSLFNSEIQFEASICANILMPRHLLVNCRTKDNPDEALLYGRECLGSGSIKAQDAARLR